MGDMTTDTSSLQLDDSLFGPLAEGTLPLDEANRAFRALARSLGEALCCELRLDEQLTDVTPGSASAILAPVSAAFGPLSISLHVKASILITDDVVTIEALIFFFSRETRLKGPGCDYSCFLYDRSAAAWRFLGAEEDAYEEWTDV
jgi:hypothetical protein